MNVVLLVFSNKLINLCLLSWFLAQLIKVVIILATKKKLDFSRFIGSGGMPSSHTSLVTALCIGVGRCEGFSSAVFAMAVVFALVVMYDASGVRRAAGQQAKILNMLVEHWNDKDLDYRGKKLKELLGHTPIEVFAGAILGTFIGFVYPL